MSHCLRTRLFYDYATGVFQFVGEPEAVSRFLRVIGYQLRFFGKGFRECTGQAIFSV
ncbi:hypothetical protein [Cupriavidus sp. D39]|uniref:hypothetical protein n=1 Tax=Cupriavidus sp. D39 TaxID=2997877 RepID=UPI00226FF26A|nr:hypothetical protein [Cupriavidus sp. D39]MCY0853428.1 hypothetical protein [Cupriavidus sp. D39]